MKGPQVVPLDESGLNYVHTLLSNHLINPAFSYTLTINKSPIPLYPGVSSIAEFELVKEKCMNDESIYCVDITFRNGKGRGGSRIVLADTDADANFNPIELAGYPKYANAGQQQREKEIVDRAKMEWHNDSLLKENELLKESVTGLKEQLKKADEFSVEVEKLIIDLKEKSQDKGTLEQVGDFIGKVSVFAPGLLKNSPLEGIIKGAEIPTAPLGNTTAVPKTEAQSVAQNVPQYDQETLALCETMKSLKPYFSDFEFQDCFKLLGLLARYKPMIPELYELALDEVKRQAAIRQQAAVRKQQVQNPKQSQQEKAVENPSQKKEQDESQKEIVQAENSQTEHHQEENTEDEPEFPNG